MLTQSAEEILTDDPDNTEHGWDAINFNAILIVDSVPTAEVQTALLLRNFVASKLEDTCWSASVRGAAPARRGADAVP